VDFELTETQRDFQDSVRGFAERHLAKDALARAHNERFPWEVARAMAGAGLFGIMLPEADGGAGGTLLDAVLAMQEIAYVCPRSADVLQAGNFGAFRTFAEYATAEQKKRFFARLLQGEAIAAVAMTEPDAGSALTELKSACTPDGNGYRLNGDRCSRPTPRTRPCSSSIAVSHPASTASAACWSSAAWTGSGSVSPATT
jgi:alkylation response protein AidB-like acyl-CoA dehydrogenase